MNKPLIIRASAGTGKTYRLSLEFINLLLQGQVNFDEILVITFTKKATAEIRNRIFEQLEILISNSKEGIELRKSFIENINRSVKFDQAELNFLQQVYQRMITSKSNVKISTIDSFVNNIFSGIIAPFNNIQEFKIDNTINQEILPEIYEHVLQAENFPLYSDIFTQKRNRNLERFNQLILDIIENRWLFNFINLKDFDISLIKTNSEKYFEEYSYLVTNFLKLLNQEITVKNKKLLDILKLDFIDNLWRDRENEVSADISIDLIRQVLMDKKFVSEKNKLLLKSSIYKANLLRSAELKELSEEIRIKLAEYLYWSEAYMEQYSIVLLASEIFNVYDKIKMRDKVFTHNDISYYTLIYLYDPELSVIDRSSVFNVFYEQLSYKIRYLLIDEFQDTSILQWLIFKPILQELFSGSGQKDYGGAIIVGDEKQAIYGWRGGERKLLTSFQEILDLPIANDDLKTSYRSRPVIIHNLNRLFDHQQLNFTEHWQHEAISCDKKEGGYLQIILKNTKASEAIQDDLSRPQLYKKFVREELQPLLDRGALNPRETAIIMRKNIELAEMAAALQEAGISFSLETSGSLFQHRAIKPLIHILNFLIYDDLLELIKFWRSDLILMYPAEIDLLLNSYKQYKSLNEFLFKEDSQSGFQLFYKLRTENYTILQTIKLILEEFAFTRIFSTENDLQNIFRLLEIAAQFEKTEHEQKNDLNGFLTYCRAIEAKDEFSALGQKESDCLVLLTIHKAKGLQFETVFSFFDITARPGNAGAGLRFYYRFNEQFDLLTDMAITFNYDYVLQLTSKSSLIAHIKQKESDDELNNIYVALTRAKNNLFIQLHYHKKGDLNDLFKSIDEKSPLLRKFAHHLYREFSAEMQEISPTEQRMRVGEICIEPEKGKAPETADYEPGEIFRITSQPEFQKITEADLHKLKREILENQSIQIGNLVHYYLSYIYFDNTEARENAYNKTLAKYGSLFTRENFNSYLKKTEDFLDNNESFYSRDHWDRVFNEFTIFDEQGRELRIDRLQVNSRLKKILLIDYKTGPYYDQNQLQRYKQIIARLPVVKQKSYQIFTEFLEITINKE